MLNILITGGCGFIGFNLINHILNTRNDIYILNIDKLNYPSNINLLNINDFEDRYKFIPISILENDTIYSYLCDYNIDYVIHCASQSHIDDSFNNSINNLKSFLLKNDCSSLSKNIFFKYNSTLSILPNTCSSYIPYKSGTVPLGVSESVKPFTPGNVSPV